MEIVQLEFFVAVVEHGGITSAARELHRAPSNVSTRIRDLERSLGLTLFVRHGRSIHLSTDGESLLDYARQILHLVEEARSLSRRGEPTGPLTVGAIESTAVARVPRHLADFHMHFPEVRLTVKSGPADVLHEGLLVGELAATFTDIEPNLPQVTGLPVFTEELVIITPRSIESLHEVREGPAPTIYTYGYECSYRRRFERWLAEEGVRVGRVVELSSYPTMVACVAAGGGMSMVPRSLLAQLPASDAVQAHAVSESLAKVDTWLTWRRESRSPALRAFIEQFAGSRHPQKSFT